MGDTVYTLYVYNKKITALVLAQRCSKSVGDTVRLSVSPTYTVAGLCKYLTAPITTQYLLPYPTIRMATSKSTLMNNVIKAFA